jgi:hypothetical protein
MPFFMRLFPVHDSDLRAFVGAPRTLRVWLRYPHAVPDLALEGHWRDLDALLAAQPGSSPAGPLRPQAADFAYPFVTEGGAHALSFNSTRGLLALVERIGRADVERFVRDEDTRGTPATETTDRDALARVDELLHHLTRLRLTLAMAVGKGYGILMALWEGK